MTLLKSRFPNTFFLSLSIQPSKKEAPQLKHTRRFGRLSWLTIRESSGRKRSCHSASIRTLLFAMMVWLSPLMFSQGFSQSTSVPLPDASPTNGANFQRYFGNRPIRDSMNEADRDQHQRIYRAPAIAIASGEVCLQDLVDLLNGQGFAVEVDYPALEEEGLDANALIQINSVSSILGVQLENAFRAARLAMIFDQGVLRITSHVANDEQQIVVLFDVSPLNMNPEELYNALLLTVDPMGWEQNGGPAGASISVLRVNGRVIFSIRNTSANIFQVSNFMNKLAVLGHGLPGEDMAQVGERLRATSPAMEEYYRSPPPRYDPYQPFGPATGRPDVGGLFQLNDDR